MTQEIDIKTPGLGLSRISMPEAPGEMEEYTTICGFIFVVVALGVFVLSLRSVYSSCRWTYRIFFC